MSSVKSHIVILYAHVFNWIQTSHIYNSSTRPSQKNKDSLYFFKMNIPSKCPTISLTSLKRHLYGPSIMHLCIISQLYFQQAFCLFSYIAFLSAVKLGEKKCRLYNTKRNSRRGKINLGWCPHFNGKAVFSYIQTETSDCDTCVA